MITEVRLIHSRPDSLGRISYTLVWPDAAREHDSIPHPGPFRGQCFFCNPLERDRERGVPHEIQDFGSSAANAAEAKRLLGPALVTQRQEAALDWLYDRKTQLAHVDDLSPAEIRELGHVNEAIAQLAG